VDPPRCGVAIDAYADCAGKCDATVKPGEVPKCDEGKLQGTCTGECSGSCEADAAAACSGECSGTCDVAIKGECSGTCQGKCDGKATPAGAGASCSGTCDGKCSGNVKATCSGKCGGSCAIKGKASCSGTCGGSCSVDMQAPKCTGKLEPPQMSAECKAKCDARLEAKAECTPPHVILRVHGAADAKAAAAFVSTMTKDLPAVLTVAIGMADRLGELANSVQTVVSGVQATVQGAGDPMIVGKLTACVGAPFKGALDAVGSAKADVNVSVSVQASASGGTASASASGKAG
jgi:modification target Cys-rich repeat protein